MNAKSPKRLGRGLDALLGGPAPESRRVLEMDIHRIHPNPSQPRKAFREGGLSELADSIRANGILQPILVRHVDGGYEIIAGERRWRAAQAAGLHQVPILVKDVEEEKRLELALVENLQREDLNPVEEARAYRLLIDELGYTQETVAEKVGKDRATVANMLRLLKLPDSGLKALEEGMITIGHAKAILARRKQDDQQALLEQIVAKGLSVREAEKRSKAAAPRNPMREDPDTKAASRKLSGRIGLPVAIQRRGKGGRVVIAFQNEDELQRLYDVIFGTQRER
jgi:ParB family transcriptional regulator, chromosome partitioning protein